MSTPPIHASHPAIVSRLKRAEGHLRSVIAMIEAGRPCVDIAQQLQAVEKAVAGAKRTLIHDHIDHCLDTLDDLGGDTNGDRGGSPADRAELKTITRYL